MVLDINHLGAVLANRTAQADPNRVPRPAAMEREGDSFAATLRATERRTDETRDRGNGATRRERDADRFSEEPSPPANTETRRAEAEATADRTSAHAVADGEPQPATAPVAATDLAEGRTTNQTERRVGPQPVLQGKGLPNPDAPTSHLSAQSRTAAATTADTAALAAQVAGAPTMGPAQGPAAAIATESGATLRVHGTAEASTKATLRTSPATPGFRTYSPQLLQGAEQARDSIFRQIAFRVTGDRSEMRVLLDPPELGQMDMNLVLDKAGVMQLSIQTERPELALMLEKHMGELQKALAAQGIDIGSAQVGTRAGGQSADHAGADTAQHPGHAQDDLTDPETWIRQGYIAADGLDYWV